MADAFLWEPLTSPAAVPRAQIVFDTPEVLTATPPYSHGSDPATECVIDVTPAPMNQDVIPAGMFNQWPLEVLLHIDKPFTGLVVLIDAITHRRHLPLDENMLRSVTACVAGLLGENDFGCRTTQDEFVMVCPGQQGAEAQRRLNYISEQLWEFQQHGYGAVSLLFSWGGVGLTERPLSEAVASAVHRMNHMNRSRNISKESVNCHRKVV